MKLLLFVLQTGVIFSAFASLLPFSVRRGGGGGGRGGSKGSYGRTPVSGGKSSNKSRADCFPSGATIVTKQHGLILMEKLAVGDIVETRSGWSPVFTFSHADAKARSDDFVRIYAPPHALTISSGHFLFVHGRGEEAAHSVRQGDILYGGKGQLLRVERVHFSVVTQGLYNPHTVDGTIVVDGVLTSTFTGAIKSATAKSMLAPFRMAFSICGYDLSGGVLERGNGIRRALVELGRWASIVS